MSLFICDKCGVLENTACCDYWSLSMDYHSDKKKLQWSEELKPFEGHKFLCSECAKIKYDENGCNPVVVKGEWHNKFDKEYPNGWSIRRMRKDKNIIN